MESETNSAATAAEYEWGNTKTFESLRFKEVVKNIKKVIEVLYMLCLITMQIPVKKKIDT